MKPLHLKYSLSFCMLAMYSGSLFAQGNLSEQVNVVRPYKPVLAEAAKINTNPEIKTEVLKSEPFNYNIQPNKLDSLLKPAPIQTEKMKNESITKLYKTYIKLGGGNYRTSLGELYFSNTRSREFQAGIHLKHNASVGSIKNMDFSENKVELFGKRIYRNHVLSMKLNYDRDVAHFYGYNHDLFKYSRREVRQQFDYFDLQTEFNKNVQQISEKVNYKGILKAYTVSDAFNANEKRLFIGASGKYDFVHLETGLDFAKHSDSSGSVNNIFSFNPSIVLQEDKLLFTLGLNTYAEFGDRNLFHVYPNIHAEYSLIENALLVYGGMNGKMQKNSFRSFYQENPFLSQNQVILNTNEKLHLFAGIRGSISNKTAYRLSVSHINMGKEAYYTNDTADIRKYKLIYDGNNSTTIRMSAELTHQQNDKLRLNGRLSVNKYTTDTLREAWYRPMLNVSITADYNIGNKFLLSAEAHAYSKMKGAVYFPNMIMRELPGGLDLNIGIDYRYSKIISVFAKFNNITGYKRERYLYYPGYGFNALAGATFSF